MSKLQKRARSHSGWFLSMSNVNTNGKSLILFWPMLSNKFTSACTGTHISDVSEIDCTHVLVTIFCNYSNMPWIQSIEINEYEKQFQFYPATAPWSAFICGHTCKFKPLQSNFHYLIADSPKAPAHCNQLGEFSDISWWQPKGDNLLSTVITCLQGNKLHKGGKIARLIKVTCGSYWQLSNLWTLWILRGYQIKIHVSL